jgi:hypothetical protein
MSEKRARSRRRKRRPLAGAGDLAWAFVRRHVPDAKVRLLRLQSLWSELATPRIAARTWPTWIEGTELKVAVQDNQWLHELAYLRQDLLDRIRREVPEAGIESLRLRLGRVPELDDRRPDAPRPPTRRGLSSDPPPETIEALSGIHDAELRDLAAAARMTLGTEGEPEPGSGQ